MRFITSLLLSMLLYVSSQAQNLSTFDVAGKTNINAFRWTEVSSGSDEEMMIADLCVEFVPQQARMTHQSNITNHITKSPTTVSLSGKIIKGNLYDGMKVIGTARFARIGTSMAGTADIGNETYQFAPNARGEYSWTLEAPFQCGTDDEHRNCNVQTPEHIHGADCKHAHQQVKVPSGPKSPMSCVTESIQDVAFITDDLMTLYGNDLNAILAQIAISDSWAEDIMEDSGFPDVAFFQESVNVVQFAESGSTSGNLQVFNDSLFATPAGIIATIAQNATSAVTVLYSVGGGGVSGSALLGVYPLPANNYYMSVLGNNGGFSNYVKMHEYGHSLWGGDHENTNPNPVIYRRAYNGVDANWGQYVTVMGRGDFPGVRLYCFSTSVPGASYWHVGAGQSFSPIGSSDRDMVTRITQEWNRPGIVQTVDITPSTPTISAGGATTFCQGGSVVLSVNNPETGVTYHWSNNQTGNSITVSTAGSFSCYGQSSSTCTGGTSNSITVVVNPLVTVTQQPTSVTVIQGQPFTLTCAGSNVISYQWYHGTTPISGATSASYTVSVATLPDAGSYYCELTNGCGSVNTNTVTVTVTPLMLTIAPTSVTVSASSGNTSFTITSNETWSIVTSDNLVIATPSSGNGNSTINVSYPAITTMAGETYTCTITSASNIVQIFTINQSGVSAFIVLTPDQANVPATAGQLTFNVNCPSDLIWDVTGLASWLSAAPLSGMGPGTVTLNYAANPNQTSRSDDFSVSGSSASATFQITQVGTNAPLEAYANSDKTVYTLGQTVQLWGSATGGTGNYTYEWTGTGGFTSQLQNPTVTPSSEGSYTYTVIVNDGSNTATDNVVVGVWEVSISLWSDTQIASVGQPIEFLVTINMNANDPRTVDEIIVEMGDGNQKSGTVNPFGFSYAYQAVDWYDIEITATLSDGSIVNETFVGFIDIIVGIDEQPTPNFKIYPNPTSGNIFIDAGKSVERLSIFDSSGREVYTIENPGQHIHLDLSGFASGIYLIKMNGLTSILEKLKSLP